jgi:hypothetical protein
MSATQQIPGLEACELKGAAAEAVISASKFGDLEELALVPIEDDGLTKKFQRAGFSTTPSERSAFRSTQND